MKQILRRLKKAYKEGNSIAIDILESYSKAEFFTNLPDIDEEIKVVTYVAEERGTFPLICYRQEIKHTLALIRELHGKCMISEKAQDEIKNLQKKTQIKVLCLLAEKGTMQALVPPECRE